MTLRNLIFILIMGCITFTACSPDESVDPIPVEDYTERFSDAADVYANIVFASYEDSYNEAVALRDMINDFVANPTEDAFNACKEQWLAARVPYGQTEVYRFYGGPIDDEDGPEGLINAWPMDENFIDYVEGDATTGLINDAVTYPEITKQVLVDLNEAISEESIFTGYHAIEFLLWGQDLFADSPGLRPYTDYVVGGTADNQERRGLYLTVVADLLVDHLGEVMAEWEPNASNYRSSFLAESKETIVNNIFTALGELSKGELSGERMFVAVDSGDQENEHSCFADNTHVDIIENYRGLVNVYTGSYLRTTGATVSGESYSAIGTEINPEKAAAVTSAIAVADAAIKAIPVPFDQAIINDQQLVLDAVTALENLSDAFTDIQVDLENQ